MIYTEEWQKARASKYDPWSKRAFLALLASEGIPGSMIDVGCGSGHLVILARALGVEAFGCDLVPGVESTIGDDDPEAVIIPKDLRLPIAFPKRWPSVFDLVISWEVAEHLPPNVADTFVQSLARHVGRTLVFTAAQPGQGGDGHLNERPPYYWREKFKDHGLTYDDKATQRLRLVWKDVTGPAWWYARNALILRK